MTTMRTRAELDAEATRVVMGCAGARLRHDVTDLRFLIGGFVRAAAQAGWEESQAWNSLAVAGIIWTTQLTYCHADHAGVSVEAAVQQLAAAAVELAADDSG